MRIQCIYIIILFFLPVLGQAQVKPHPKDFPSKELLRPRLEIRIDSQKSFAFIAGNKEGSVVKAAPDHMPVFIPPKVHDPMSVSPLPKDGKLAVDDMPNAITPEKKSRPRILDWMN